MRIIEYTLAFAFIITQIGCSNSQSSNRTIEKTKTDKKEYVTDNDGCGFSDDTYSATVDYNNPNTGYSATYTLDVEVENCQVVQIDFPNGGYLDDDHITPADIDDDGEADVEGEDGKTYNVHLDVSDKKSKDNDDDDN